MRMYVHLVVTLATLIYGAAPLQKRPHIIFTMIDDLGWADVAWHKEGNTDVLQPHVSELVKEALILDRHYVFPYCSPTRASLMSYVRWRLCRV